MGKGRAHGMGEPWGQTSPPQQQWPPPAVPLLQPPKFCELNAHRGQYPGSFPQPWVLRWGAGVAGSSSGHCSPHLLSHPHLCLFPCSEMPKASQGTCEQGGNRAQCITNWLGATDIPECVRLGQAAAQLRPNERYHGIRSDNRAGRVENAVGTGAPGFVPPPLHSALLSSAISWHSPPSPPAHGPLPRPHTQPYSPRPTCHPHSHSLWFLSCPFLPRCPCVQLCLILTSQPLRLQFSGVQSSHPAMADL